jgi:hypothetical protein
MGIPVKKLGKIPTMKSEELVELLSTTECSIDGKIAALLDIKMKIVEKKRLIGEVDHLRSNSFAFCAPDIAKVISDPLFETDILSKPVRDFSQCALFIPRGPRQMPRCALVMLKEYEGDNIIWERDAERRYMECLLEASSDDPADNNLNSITHSITELGYKPGAFIGRYLTSAFDGKRCEYYHAWIEVD